MWQSLVGTTLSAEANERGGIEVLSLGTTRRLLKGHFFTNVVEKGQVGGVLE